MKMKKRGRMLALALLPFLGLALAMVLRYTVYAADKVTLLGVEHHSYAKFLNLDGQYVEDIDLFIAELSQFPDLMKVEITNSNVTNEQMEQVMAAYPDVEFVWTLRFKRWSLRTDARAFSTLQPKVITHMMDNEDVKNFVYCKDMVALDLGHNRITDITPLAGLTKLRALILVDNPISDITICENFHELMYFESFCTRIADYAPLSTCENMVDLNISYSRVYDITPLMHFPKLERLWFTHTQISEADRWRLLARYPDVKYDYTSGTSIEAGWRNHVRFNNMRTMYFKKNVVVGYFKNTEADNNYDYIYEYRDLIFDADYYAAMHPDAVNLYGTGEDALFRHFVYYGLWEGRSGCIDFNVCKYRASHPELEEVWGNHLPGYVAAYIKECIGE